MKNTSHSPLPLKQIFRTWWPLAASWALMGLEMPALSAFVARLANPEINLAAYGGIVFPISLIIESPIIMLLAASTALSRDWPSYRKIWTFMMSLGSVLTALHVVVAFTPLYYFVVEGIIGAPQEIVEPARLGLMIMTPWTWSIAYRRFNQGVLIRYGDTRAVGVGTIFRLSADILVMAIGFWLKSFPGVVVATSAVATGVVVEAAYVGLRVRPALRKLRTEPLVKPPLSLREFLRFYIPLVLTSLLTLIAQPIGSAALSRMPSALESLAVWPVISGLIFLFRSLGIAYNEVVIALLDQPASTSSLRRFAWILAVCTSGSLLLMAATPLSEIWFVQISALPAHLAGMAHVGLWIALLLPASNTFVSWYQGAILFSKRTRAVPEAVGIFLVALGVTLAGGIYWGRITGLYIGLAAYLFGTITQTIWLWLRSKKVVKTLLERDDPLPHKL